MLYADNSNGPNPREQITVAVAIAALSSLATGLIGWGISELRQKFGSKPKDNQ